MKIPGLLFFLSILVPVLALAQKPVYLKIIEAENHRPVTLEKDSAAAIAAIRILISQYHYESFLAATATNLYKDQDTIFAIIEKGQKFEWAALRKGNLNDFLLQRADYKEKLYSNTIFNKADFIQLEDKILKYSEENGYPFASIRLDSMVIKDASIEGALNYNHGPLIKFDSIVIIGKTRTKPKFLARHLRIIAGQPFNQERIRELDRTLRQLSYINQTRPAELVFVNNVARITLFLEDKKTNQIDGIVGFLPNTSNDKKLLVTGELNLNLKNLFGTGKALQLEWKKLTQFSQQLDAGYFHPKLIGSNLDVFLNFNLFKQDTLFLTINRGINLSHPLSRYGRINFNTGLKTSRVLSKSVIREGTKDPLYADFNHYTYGIGYEWNTLNDIFYPKQGWFIRGQVTVGNKNIRSLPPESSLPGSSIQFSVGALADKYFKLNKKSVLVSRISAAKMFNNNQSLFYNDLYRVGGLRNLRGFNENNFYATSYGITTVEYRFFTEETSYLLLFIDQGYVENSLNPVNKEDFPTGFGAGVSFATGPGIFNFIYSLGSSKDQKISINVSKIHFGIISRF